MGNMFSFGDVFNGDISKWRVSRVKSMRAMFYHASSFNGDLSKWDVSSVYQMNDMFSWAKSFNGDISKWDVSSVTNMDNMFRNAESFQQSLCGAAWVHSMASKELMFANSPGSISDRVCKVTPTPVTDTPVTPTAKWTPDSSAKLRSAIERCDILENDGT